MIVHRTLFDSTFTFKYILPLQIATSMQPPPIPDNLSPPIRDILLRCLEQKKTERPTAKELLVHPLFTQYMTSTSSKCWRATFPSIQLWAMPHHLVGNSVFIINAANVRIFEKVILIGKHLRLFCAVGAMEILFFYIPPTSDIWLKVCPSLKTVWYSDIALHSCACIFEIHLFTFDRQCYSIQRIYDEN